MTKKQQWENESEQVAAYYIEKISSKGYTFDSLAGREEKYTNMFFDKLFSGIEIQRGFSFLDIGSGLGFFVDYLKQKEIVFSDYLGVDLINEFIDYSKTKYSDCKFVHANFISDDFSLDKKYDFVFALGVLVSRVSNYEDYLLEFVKKMISFSQRYVLFNLVTQIDPNTKNYKNRDEIGGITNIGKIKLTKILDSIPNISYKILEKKIFDDATDAFVQIKLNSK